MVWFDSVALDNANGDSSVYLAGTTLLLVAQQDVRLACASIFVVTFPLNQASPNGYTISFEGGEKHWAFVAQNDNVTFVIWLPGSNYNLWTGQV